MVIQRILERSRIIVCGFAPGQPCWCLLLPSQPNPGLPPPPPPGIVSAVMGHFTCRPGLSGALQTGVQPSCSRLHVLSSPAAQWQGHGGINGLNSISTDRAAVGEKVAVNKPHPGLQVPRSGLPWPEQLFSLRALCGLWKTPPCRWQEGPTPTPRRRQLGPHFRLLFSLAKGSAVVTGSRCGESV